MVATFKQGRQTVNICIYIYVCIYKYISYINILWYCAQGHRAFWPQITHFSFLLETKAIFTSSKSKSRYCNLGIQSPPHLFQTTQKIPSLVSLCLLIAPWLKCGDRNLEISSESILSNISSLSSHKLPCMARFWDWCVEYLLPTSQKKKHLEKHLS